MELEAIRDRMGLLIDRIMSEAGLYAPEYAALALKQCEGSPEEAVFLLQRLSQHPDPDPCLPGRFG